MEFVILTEEEFNNYEIDHEYGSFYQTSKWAKLKEQNGWKHFYVGIKKDNKIISAALLLKKNILRKLSLIYSPRGYLTNYNDYTLLEFFTKNIKKFAKKENAIFVKIDPYVIYKERNINGDIVSGGIDNTSILNNLNKLGYINIATNNLQPKYAFVLNLKNKTIDEVFNNMETTTKQGIRKNDKSGVTTREISIDELNKFCDIMATTADRRGFIDRPYEYYLNMMKFLNTDIKVFISEINLDNYITNLTNELGDAKNKINYYNDLLKKDNTNTKKITNQLKEVIIIKESLEKKINKTTKIREEKGSVLELGCLLFILHNKEILSLFGGAYGEYRDFMPAYSLNYNMIKYGILNGYDKYNFYGISEFKDKNNEMYGLYDFKRGFDGNVEEYIGEYDLIISKFWYYMYKIGYEKIYKKMKKSSNH